MAERGQPDRVRAQEPHKRAAQPVAPSRAAAPKTAAQKLTGPKAPRPAASKPAEVRLVMRPHRLTSVWLPLVRLIDKVYFYLSRDAGVCSHQLGEVFAYELRALNNTLVPHPTIVGGFL